MLIVAFVPAGALRLALLGGALGLLVAAVLLRLHEPHHVRVGLFGGGMAEAIVMNVDRRDQLLAILNNERGALNDEPFGFAQGRPGTLNEGKQLAEGSHPKASIVHPESTPVIRANGLTRRYGHFTAVAELNLAVAPGEIYGFLGMNGAGKTTSFKMLTGLLEPDAGRAWIAGHDVWAAPLAARAALGYAPDRAMLYERLSGREFLAFLAQIRGLSLHESRWRIADLLDILDLSRHADRRCGSYSLGVRRKLSLAGALLHQPAVLILDEPLNGLDPRSARRVKDVLADLAGGGTAILLSTHDLATAETICHRVGIIDGGRLIVEGHAAALQAAAAQPDLESLSLSLTAPSRRYRYKHGVCDRARILSR